MTQTLAFPDEASAELALSRAGFSLGTIQRDDPRGMMHGDWDIQKWRNLSSRDRADLHGVWQRSHRDGPVQIRLTEKCPADAAAALARIRATLSDEGAE